ncbi:cytochrome P450 [Henriciella mobilis]|uniref:Cytochrome P450 n=1 Tax=Henriciella mobilis TaxID=2305467 RepID=A0A399RH46_9PROT|nr:cytochrome P450 [Henriciella mobilis]RIJ29843.1 cytochrome P450 [Henriciella mobilis]
MGAMPESDIPEHVPPERVVEFDFYNDARIQKDIHDGLIALRSEAPGLFWTPFNGGHWVVLDTSAISTVLRTPKVFSSRQLQIPPRQNAPVMIPESLDPPEHLLYRRLMMSWFEPRQIAHLKSRVDHWTKHFVANVKDKGGCEFVEAVASRIPVTVFMEFVGFPLDRHEDFRSLIDGMFRSSSPEESQTYAMKIMGELQTLISARMDKREDDLLSRLIDADFEGRKLTFEELMSIGFLLFLAGLDTVTNAMSFGTRHLARYPDFQTQLRAHPERCAEAAEELLRRYTFPNLPRQVAKDTELDGVALKAGEMVLCVIAMAGLDESLNPNATDVRLDREKRNHFAFGYGGHTCLGRHLAKMELEAFYRHWLAEIPPFRIDSSKPPSGVRGGSVMGLSSLHLTWS